MTAAFLDYATTGELHKAIARGDAPPPSATRLRNGKREPVWLRLACVDYLARRHNIPQHNNTADLTDMAKFV